MSKVIVRGVVSRINKNGVGFGVRESWPNRDGGTSERYWAVWMPHDEPTRVVVGDEVEVTGRLSAKVSTRNPRFVDYHVQNAVVAMLVENGPRTWTTDQVSEEPPENPWPVAEIPDATPAGFTLQSDTDGAPW